MTNNDAVKVFKFEGKLAPEGAVFNNKTAEELRGNATVEIYDRETHRCQFFGDVTEAYQYGGLTILALRDADEPLAWAMILNDDGTVTHYDKTYDVLAIEEKAVEPLDGWGFTISVEGVKKFAETGQGLADDERSILKIINSSLSVEKPIMSEKELHRIVTERAAAGTLDFEGYDDAWEMCRFCSEHLCAIGILESVQL